MMRVCRIIGDANFRNSADLAGGLRHCPAIMTRNQHVDVATADQLILTVKKPVENPKIMINREELPGGLDEVEKRIEELMRGRREKVVFFQSENEIQYDFVIKVMDRIRGGGAEKIGLITDETLDVTSGP